MLETKLGDFEEVILLITGILGESAAYALRISQEFEIQTGRNISVGSVHSALDRLEEKGFLVSQFGPPTAERGGRRKRIFIITALGRKTLQQSKEFKQSLWRQFPGFELGTLQIQG
jgi:PadR family transcriptional regulator PadR